MKLLRVGVKGKEKPAALDKNGKKSAYLFVFWGARSCRQSGHGRYGITKNIARIGSAQSRHAFIP